MKWPTWSKHQNYSDEYLYSKYSFKKNSKTKYLRKLRCFLGPIFTNMFCHSHYVLSKFKYVWIFQHQELLKNEYYKSNLSHFLFKMESVNAFTYTSTIEKTTTKYYLFRPLSFASFKDIVLNITLLYFFYFF